MPSKAELEPNERGTYQSEIISMFERHGTSTMFASDVQDGR